MIVVKQEHTMRRFGRVKGLYDLGEIGTYDRNGKTYLLSLEGL